MKDEITPCEECKWLLIPFHYCVKRKWVLDDGKSIVEGCNRGERQGVVAFPPNTFKGEEK